MIKRIFLFWGQGIENAPKLVRKCVSTWKRFHPDFDVVVLDSSSVNDWIDSDLIPSGISWAAKTDIIRLLLLNEHGGFWVDATVCCRRSLPSWVEPYVDNGFFSFSSCMGLKSWSVSSWFLYGEPGNYIISTWKSKTMQYWKNRKKPHLYLWMHGLFKMLYEQDPQFRHEVLKIPFYDNGPNSFSLVDNPHLFLAFPGYTSLHLRVGFIQRRLISAMNECPVYKLTLKSITTDVRSGTVCQFLFDPEQYEESNADLVWMILCFPFTVVAIIVLLVWHLCIRIDAGCTSYDLPLNPCFGNLCTPSKPITREDPSKTITREDHSSESF